MTISDMKNGSSAQIVHVDLLSPLTMRLLEMGFTSGTRLRLIGRSPVGETLLVDIRRRTLMLRKDEADAITVREITAL